MKKDMPSLLYVEDDKNLAFVTTDNLREKQYDVTHCASGNEALKLFNENHFDLCILDVMLPDMDGFMLARVIRNLDKDIPLIFLTAKSMTEDKITGLRTGADDYILKPFSMEELYFKIEIFLRRSKFSNNPPAALTPFELGNMRFNFGNLELVSGNKTTTLTLKEGELLQYLLIHKNRVLKREEILKAIWGNDEYFTGRSLDVFISRLRKYLSPSPHIRITNVHGVGFKLEVNFC